MEQIMKVSTLIAVGLALIALDAAQASFAAPALGAPASANSTYYPSGEQVAAPVMELPRVVVREQALAASHTLPTTWREFGAGSHDESLSSQTRAEVSNEALSASHPAARSYFSY